MHEPNEYEPISTTTLKHEEFKMFTYDLFMCLVYLHWRFGGIEWEVGTELHILTHFSVH